MLDGMQSVRATFTAQNLLRCDSPLQHHVKMPESLISRAPHLSQTCAMRFNRLFYMGFIL
jgi:hypothetical protein